MTTELLQKPEKMQEIQSATSKSIERLVSKKWKLKSIFEAGIVSDEATFSDVELVFGPNNIYALYGNRVDRYRYKLLSDYTFIAQIEGVDVKCRITENNVQELIFHADFKDAHFIVSLESA